MPPRELIKQWVEFFNEANAEKLASLYADDAINHQVNTEPVNGKAAIYEMFKKEFETAEMVCQVENIFEDGEWAHSGMERSIGFKGLRFFSCER